MKPYAVRKKRDSLSTANPMRPLPKTSLVAPCGMNCGICMAFLREKNHCCGCRASDTGKSVSCLRCKIKNCRLIRNGRAKYCFACADYPCQNIKHLDKRYRTRYNMSMIENLERIKQNGIRRFVKHEEVRWRCDACGGTVCVHRGRCSRCGARCRRRGE